MSKAISGLPIADALTGYELVPVVQDGTTVQATATQFATLVGALSYVPYSGATTNVNLGEWGITAGYHQFDLTPTQGLQVGRMQWNAQDGTAELRLMGNNVTLQIGQESVVRVVNKTGGDLLEANYQAVRLSGAQGNRLKVSLARADNDANSAETLGLVTETILNNQEGFVTSSGLVRNINTTGSLQGETWADGDVLYLSGTNYGVVTNIKPVAPIHTVIVGYVVRAHATQGEIFVKVDNGYEIDELHNVRIQSVADKNVLRYESATSLWKNIAQTDLTAGLVENSRTSVGLRFWTGSQAQYDALTPDSNTLYFIV